MRLALISVAPPDMVDRLLPLFMKLSREERALCMFSKQALATRVEEAIKIFEAQDESDAGGDNAASGAQAASSANVQSSTVATSSAGPVSGDLIDELMTRWGFFVLATPTPSPTRQR
jgi:hypothetical protein